MAPCVKKAAYHFGHPVGISFIHQTRHNRQGLVYKLNEQIILLFVPEQNPFIRANLL
jgi:CRISPR/Cas system-associated endonuclease Cas1